SYQANGAAVLPELKIFKPEAGTEEKLCTREGGPIGAFVKVLGICNSIALVQEIGAIRRHVKASWSFGSLLDLMRLEIRRNSKFVGSAQLSRHEKAPPKRGKEQGKAGCP